MSTEMRPVGVFDSKELRLLRIHPPKEEPSTANERQKLRFCRQTDMLLRAFSVAKHHHSGNAAYAELASGERSFVDIELSYDAFFTQLVRHLIDDRGQLLTRSAPSRRKVDQNGLITLEDCFLEIQIIEDLDVFGCHDFFNITPRPGAASRQHFLLKIPPISTPLIAATESPEPGHHAP